MTVCMCVCVCLCLDATVYKYNVFNLFFGDVYGFKVGKSVLDNSQEVTHT